MVDLERKLLGESCRKLLEESEQKLEDSEPKYDESEQNNKKHKKKKKKRKKVKTTSQSDLNISNFENYQNIKNFFDQKEPKFGEQWTDDIFPPNNESIIGNSQKYNDLFESEENDIDINDIEWKRANDIFYEPKLFSGNINLKEITNGKICSSYFISAISAICEYPGLIQKIFINKEYNPDGYYTLLLYIDGEYQSIYLDDYFPCLKGTNIPYFSKLNNNNSLWFLLLEKAWAKINRSYKNAISGWPNDVFRAFTGFSCEELNHNEENNERIWRIIKSVKENKGIICTSSKNEEDLNEVGLIPGFTYTVINTYELEDEKKRKIFLLKLRNDLGNSEWNGDWSKQSVYWNEYIKKQIKKEEMNLTKEEFFISLNDLIKYFSRTDLCHIICDGYKKIYEFNKISDLVYPHIFNFYLNSKANISISAIEKNWRYHRELRNISHPTSLIIAEYEPDSEIIKYITCSYESYENTEKTRVLNPGYYLVWIYKSNQHEKPTPESMKIRFISGGDISIKYLGTDNNFDVIEHIIYQGVKKMKDDKFTLDEIFYDIENDFKRSGLGYRLIINPLNNIYQNWEIDIKDNTGFYYLSETLNEKLIKFDVNPNDYECVAFIRDKKYGNFGLNLKNNVKQYDCNENKKRNKERKNFVDFCTKDIKDEEILKNDKTPSLESLLNIDKLPENNCEQILKEKFKDICNLNFEEILNLPQSNSDNIGHIGFIKLENDDGIYFGEGEYATPQGRGCYVFKNNNQIWIGNFENGKKGNYGKFYDKGKLIYEGEYLNGEKNGKGKYYYDNGMIYEGEFVRNKKEGKGIFYWDEKTKWEGNWVNDKMSGEGIYTDEDDTYKLNFNEEKKDENEINIIEERDENN